ncbi:unnamed protein product [Prunus armeniaca]
MGDFFLLLLVGKLGVSPFSLSLLYLSFFLLHFLRMIWLQCAGVGFGQKIVTMLASIGLFFFPTFVQFLFLFWKKKLMKKITKNPTDTNPFTPPIPSVISPSWPEEKR